MKIYIKKNIVLVFIAWFLFLFCKAQKSETYKFTYTNFEQEILNYQPKKTDAISDMNYRKALSILENTKISVMNDNNNFVVTDYWNITLALALLDESRENIRLSFKKGIDKNQISMCQYINKVSEVSPSTTGVLTKSIPDLYSKFAKSCNIILKENDFTVIKEPVMSIEDKKLVDLMKKIQVDDAKYRQSPKEYRANLEKQTLLDIKNQKTVDSIYQIHNTYIGKSIVGEKLSITMWLVIQHSNIEMMKKYIPVVHEAVKNKEIKTTPFKMLIDRVYSIEKGYQIFGSQGGVKKANDSIRNAIIEKYQLN